MDQRVKKTDLDVDYESYGLARRLDAERAPDAAGYWFMAAVLFAFLAAGIIVYRTGHTEVQTAANYASHPASQTDQLDPQPLLLER
jgi:hypothetical protein